MNRKWTFVVAAALLGASFAAPLRAAEMSEKEKALANPYPNDFGPETLPDDVLKSYPANVQAGYKKLLSNKAGCAQCHSAARPLNSRFVEPEGGNDEPNDRPTEARACAHLGRSLFASRGRPADADSWARACSLHGERAPAPSR